jgi:hypothetical protein
MKREALLPLVPAFDSAEAEGVPVGPEPVKE